MMRRLASRVRESQPRAAAFTLIEVLLAVGIAIGLFMVLMFFYQQSAHLRTALIEETEKISAARLFLDRITLELRSAVADDFLLMGLTGGSNFVEFVTANAPARQSHAFALEPGAIASSDLKVVRYQFSPGRLTLTRYEQPLVETLLSPEAEVDEFDEFYEFDEFASDMPMDTPPGFVFENLRLLQLRYWNGAAWTDSWNDWTLPAGLEVVIGTELPAPDAPAEEPPAGLFRRVITLPTAGKPAAIEQAASSAVGGLP